MIPTDIIPTAQQSFAPDTALPCTVAPAVNVEPRANGATPGLLILHYTGMSSAAKAVQWLACAQSRVSCHYVIDEHGAITQLVPEALRAWHAGVSSWHGTTDINSASIGIEIQNPGHEHGYPDFPPAQMASVAALSRDIAARHALAPTAILAHSDIAPARKIDPGEKFDWRWLHTQGVGHWLPPAPLDATDPGHAPGSSHPDVKTAQTLLRAYGYGIEPTGTLDPATAFVLRAFQLHFRPARIDSHLDRSTLTTLQRLVDESDQASTSLTT
jgi:N-acetylmuramoyl-L-alanine amidase